MKPLKVLLMLAAILFGARPVNALDSDADIRDVLATQVELWNKGNVEAFLGYYSENCVFMGKEIVRSREKLLARYKRIYPTSGAMGKLKFTELDVREVAPQIAVATGNWHLDRSAKDGGPVGGYFSLVLKNIDDDWRIILDHTTALK